MQFAAGDLWNWYAQGYAIVVPTNIGWTRSRQNVMGRGVALQASRRFPQLALRYGTLCRQYGTSTPVAYEVVDDEHIIILFPVKPLNVSAPFLSWRGSATLDLIERSASQLRDLALPPDHSQRIALPLVGCGNGGLLRRDVVPILERHLTEDRFVLVEQV